MSATQRRASVEPSVVVKNVDGRRVVSRTNPEISYAYGAPAAAGRKTGGKKRQSAQSPTDDDEANGEEQDENAEASTSSATDAKARYQALKKRKIQEQQQQQQQQEQQQQALESPRKSARQSSPRKSKVAKETHATSMHVDASAASLNNRAVGSSAGGGPGGIGSDEMSSGARRQRMLSPGRSRSVLYGQLNSFYMDRDADSEDNIDASDRRGDNVPSSILLGTQRQSHDMLNSAQGLPELDSIHSSDIHDSRSKDYAELQREADMLEEAERRQAKQANASAKIGRKAPGSKTSGRAGGLDEVREESEAEQSSEERKHTQKPDAQHAQTKSFPSPLRPTVRHPPVPIARHSRRRYPSAPLTLLACAGVLIAVFIALQRGMLMNMVPLSALAPNANLADGILRKHIQTLEKRLGAAEKQVMDFEKRMTDANYLADRVTEAAKKLPSQVAVQRDGQSGQFKLDEKTLKELKQLFALKGEEAASSASSSSWKAFLKANEAALRKLTSDALAQESKSGTLLTRSALIETLSRELDSLKLAMEAQFNANAQEMQNEILAKVRTQQEMFERSGSWKTAKQIAAGQSGAGSGLDATRESIKALIDEALEVYSADRTGERDFALFAAGARVIPSLTSPKYVLPTATYPWGAWLVQRISNSGQTKFDRHGKDEPMAPAVALVPDNTPGMCWAFAGSQGQLGISLARRLVVSKITLEHTPASISLDSSRSAPRDVTIWGRLERPRDIKRLALYRKERGLKNVVKQAGSHDYGKQSEEDVVIDEDTTPAPMPPSERDMLLASFTYDAFGAHAVQSFPISREAQELQLPLSTVLVQIHSNHGKVESTCLYRVRIHGNEWTLDQEAASKATETL